MSRLERIWISLISVCLAVDASDCCKGSVAIVASLTGQATLSAPGSTATAIANLDWLASGVTIETGAKSTLTILLANGRRYELGERARATVSADALTGLAGPVRELQRLPPIPKPAAIAGEHGEIAGAVRFRGSSPPRNLYPNGSATTLPGIVKLSFSTGPAATVSVITLTDENGEVLWTGQTRATYVEVPQDFVKAGSRYRWRARAMGDGVVLGEAEAQFTSITESNLADRHNFASAAASIDAPARLALLASIDMQLGLFAEAIDELEAAAREAPEDRDIQRALSAARVARAATEK
jgi:hypothetical protein